MGAPASIYYKSDEKMLIQRRRGEGPERWFSAGSGEEDKPDFFFNYFTLGLVCYGFPEGGSVIFGRFVLKKNFLIF